MKLTLLLALSLSAAASSRSSHPRTASRAVKAAPAAPAAPAAAPAPAPAPASAAPAQPRWDNLGPLAHMPPTTKEREAQEKEAKQGVDVLYASLEAALQKGDAQAYAGLCDFPLLLISDDAQGPAVLTALDKEAFLKLMGPALQPLGDAKVSSKHLVKVLSESLATIDEIVTVQVGKTKATWKNTATVVRREGAWRFKSVTEAGWGELLRGQSPGAVPPVPPKPLLPPAPTPAPGSPEPGK